MTLANFIDTQMDTILLEWEAFARSLATPGAPSQLTLRDHARQILQNIARDIGSDQDPAQQYEKSQGLAPVPDDSAAAVHGAQRQASHFSLPQVGAEFRALRATVLRLWLPRVTQMAQADIADMVRFNEAIDQALAESTSTYCARADQARELFLSVLSHDLRGPLSTLSLSGQLLAHPGNAPDKVRQLSQRIQRGALQMGRMVDDLLGYTRAQLGGGMPVARRDADVAAICRAAIGAVAPLHPQRRIELRATGRPTAKVDAVLLRQMCTNLLLNAAQNGAGEVLVEAHGGADALSIRVTHGGAALDAAALAKLFQPLQQAPESADADARGATRLGLGLFVAREIARAQGGDIEVASDAEGTRYTARLALT
ncbi:HAMP domain-containing sensor histidine kinase [Janthinobacterium sp.]|uniref:sensor histidine kinase n=1 Tax=Janthinobacterium sp. TaxID=1871054 RepID=UPI00293D30E5|nr:HAMP domain-containing sensor histidine kinase [Janthinobacterium sp.]